VARVLKFTGGQTVAHQQNIENMEKARQLECRSALTQMIDIIQEAQAIAQMGDITWSTAYENVMYVLTEQEE